MTENKYNRYELIHKWLASDTYDETVNFYVHLCSQAKAYILAAFEREFESDLPSIDEESPLYGENLYWFGYVMAYWFFIEQISGLDILKSMMWTEYLIHTVIFTQSALNEQLRKSRRNDVLTIVPADTE